MDGWGIWSTLLSVTNRPFNNALEFDLKQSGIDYISVSIKLN